MKVGFSTTDGLTVDEHFGRSGMFAIYDLTGKGYQFVEMKKFAEGRDKEIEETKGLGDIHEERIREKVDSLSECKIIYITEIGGPSAARLVQKGIMPIKVNRKTLIEESLQKLLELINTSPPPWLKKAIFLQEDTK